MYFKIILNIILIISLALFQIGFVSGLPGFFSNINLFIVALILILTFSNLDLALWWALGGGLIFDYYNFFPFGLYAFSFLSSIFLGYFIFKNFFTNKSLYSFLGLTFFITIFYLIFLNAGFFFAHFFIKIELPNFFALNFLEKIGEKIFLNMIIILILFYLINFKIFKYGVLQK